MTRSKWDSMWNTYSDLVQAVRADHETQCALVAGAHNFDHALIVAQYCLHIAPTGEDSSTSWVAAICHNTDRLHPEESEAQIHERVCKLVRLANLSPYESRIAVEAIMDHSKKPHPLDGLTTKILKDADKLANLDPLTLAVRSANAYPSYPPVNLVHLTNYPPGCNYKEPGSVLRDLYSSLEWEGICEYHQMGTHIKVPWFRMEKAIELAKPRFTLLRTLIEFTIQSYKSVGLIPY